MPSFARFSTALPLIALCCPTAEAQDLLYQYGGPGFATGSSVKGTVDVDQDGVRDFTVTDNGLLSKGRIRVFSGRTGGVLAAWSGTTDDDYVWRASVVPGDIDHDGTMDVVIGNPGWSSDRGRVQVRSGATDDVLVEVQGQSPNEYVGEAIACADFDGDGTLDILLGSRTPLDMGRGRARVYSGANGSLLHEVLGTSGGDGFGLAVAVAGDIDLDGRQDFVVGSARDYGLPSDLGSAYVYSGATGQLLHYLPGYCSYAVGGAGDVNADGYPDLVTGAPNDSLPGRFSCGSVSVYSGLDGSLLMRAFGDVSADKLGWSVSGAGDVNGDGHADVIAGTQRYHPQDLEAGKARVFSGADGSILRTYASSPGHNDFGHSVAGLGDLNQDGFGDVIIGNPYSLGYALVFLGNVPAVELYCTAKVNSLGCTPELQVNGAPSLGVGDNFVVTATNVLNQRSGKWIWSLTRASVSFGGGTLCLAPGIRRTPTTSAGGSPFPANDCSGRYDFHFSHAYLTAQGIQPGTTIHAQCWSRDGGFPPPNNMGLTGGISFVVIP